MVPGAGNAEDLHFPVRQHRGIAAQFHRGLPGGVLDELAAVYAHRRRTAPHGDLHRGRVGQRLAHGSDQLGFQPLRVLGVVGVDLLAEGDDRGAVRMDRRQEKFRGLQAAGPQNRLSIAGRGPAIEADDVGRNEHQFLPVLFEGDHAGRERVVDAVGQFLPARIAGKHDGFFRRDVLHGRPSPQDVGGFRGDRAARQQQPGGRCRREENGSRAQPDKIVSRAIHVVVHRKVSWLDRINVRYYQPQQKQPQ